MLVEETHIIKP